MRITENPSSFISYPPLVVISLYRVRVTIKLLHVFTGVGIVTNAEFASLAIPAFSTSNNCANHHPISLLQLLHLASNLTTTQSTQATGNYLADDTNCFMTEDITLFHARNGIIVEV